MHGSGRPWTRRRTLLVVALGGLVAGAGLIALALLSAAGARPPRFAQASTTCPTDPFQGGSIFGQVAGPDPQQAVSNVPVSVYAEESYFNSTSQTTSTGKYLQAGVPFGPYTLSASGSLSDGSPGFSDPVEVCVQGDVTAPDIHMRVGVPPPPTPTPTPSGAPPQPTPPLLPNGHRVNASVAATPAAASYTVNQPITICVKTPPGSSYTLTDSQLGTSQLVFSDGLTDTGGCFTATISLPTGLECIRLDYLAPSSSGSTQACWQVVSN